MHKLKEKLMDALYEYEDKAARNADGKISENEIQKIHVITDTVKNIDKIEMLEGSEGSSYGSDWEGEGRIYGTSYARGRGSNARRDSMGRYAYNDGSYRNGGGIRGGNRSSYNYPYYGDGYSREDGKEEMTRKLREMISEAQSEEERNAIRHCIHAIEEL